MTSLTVNSLKINTITNDSVKIAAKPQETPKSENIKIASDNVHVGVKKGIVPTLAGLGAGAASAGLAGSLVGRYVAGSTYAQTGVIFGTLLFAIPGAVVGATVANTTDNKLKGAMIGAGVGALTGAVGTTVVGKSFDITSVGGGLILGAVAGGISGYSASFVAQKK